MNPLSIVFQVISAFFGVIALAVLFHVPKKYLMFSGLVGAIGWFVDLIVTAGTDNPMLSAFSAACFVALLSQIFARVLKAPVTVFLVSGVLPLVPGVGMYRMVYYLLQGNNVQTSYYFSYTLQMAGMIALAIFVVDSLSRMLYRKRK